MKGSKMQEKMHAARRGLLARALLGVIGCTFLSVSAHAQSYPSRPVELLVPWAPGGGSDVVARAFAESAMKHYPQPLVVVNKPGASGSIGHFEGATAKADGYKVTVVTPEINLAFLQGIGKAKYQDFTYVARINSDPIALVVRAESPWTTLEQFIAHAKANPEKITVSTSGVGATYHLASIAFSDAVDIKLNNVPYQGAGPAVTGLLSGQVDATMATTAEVGVHVQAGKMRLLGVMSDQRLKDFSTVPTFKEKNINLFLGTWRGIAVPKDTPKEIVSSLRELVNKVNQEPRYQEILARQFAGRVNEDGEVFRAALAREFETYQKIVTKYNLNQSK
jgi:tripartite-type tricarboxylate transporter receptor subunit TctC